MTSLPLRASATAFLLILMPLFAGDAVAQFVVEVRDAKTGAGVDAKVQVKSGDANRYLGRTKGLPLQSQEKCDGRLLAAAPVFPMYEAQDEDERWKPCATKVTIFLKPLVYVRVLPAEQAQMQFAAYPSVVRTIGDLDLDAQSGRLAKVSTSAKAVAEELESVGLTSEAETYWTVSAQSALAVIAEDQGVKYDGKGLVRKGDRFVFTPDATRLIRSYQQANELPNVGLLGPRTFESIASADKNRQ